MNTPSVNRKAETPLGQVTPKWAQAFILKQMFYKFLGARPERDQQLKDAFKKRFGRPMRNLLEHEMINAVYLEGPPGQGKTSVHRAATREFADLMGMRFLSKVTQRQMSSGQVTPDDVVFQVIELAGETSNKEVFGLMAKVKVGEESFMGHLPDWRLAATMMSGYGYVLFDDFATATHQVQNSCLGLLLDGTAGDLQFNMNEIGHAKATYKSGQLELTVPEDLAIATRSENASTVHFGLAGNRGARDGNKTFPITTATATRVKRFDVEDTVELWCERALQDNDDELGDCFVSTFLEQHGSEHFLRLAKMDKQMMGQSSVSRTLNMLVTDARTIFAENGGLGEIMRLPAEQLVEVEYDLEKVAQGCVGKDTAQALAVFYNALFLGAAPVAEEIIRKGQVPTDILEEKYGAGNTPQKQSFGFALSAALASFAAEDIVSALGGRNPTKKTLAALADVDSDVSKRIRETARNFSYGVNQFTNLSLTNLASTQLMRRLAVTAPALFTGAAEYRVPTVEFSIILATGMFQDNVAHQKEENIEALADSLTTYGALVEGHFENNMSSKIKATLGK